MNLGTKRASEKTSTSVNTSLNKAPWLRRARPYLIMAPAVLITIGILIPFAMAIYYSLTSYTFRLPTYKFIGLKNWISMFTNRSFWHAVWVTLRYAFFATLFEMLVGLGIAMLLTSIENRFSKFLRVVLTFPLMVAPVIGTIIWQLMTNNAVGILEKFLNIFGVYNFPWASAHETAMFTAVLIDLWVYCPFVIILITAGIQSLPKSPYESAKIDGGSAWFNFRNLTLPMLKPTIYIALLFRLMASLQEFSIIFALTKGGPGDTLMNLSVTAYNTGFHFQKFGSSLPYILVLWLIVNIVARQIVKRWMKSQQIASGRIIEE
jgi:multiple sugar transport system permease protein